MLKDPEQLVTTLTNHIKSVLTQHHKDGAVIFLDGSLMSLVNIRLLQKLGSPFIYKVVLCTFAENKQYLRQLIASVQTLDVMYDVYDLSKDFDVLSPYAVAKDRLDLEIAHRKRFTDLMTYFQADKFNLMPVDNICYSQWILNFPHESYKNLAHIYPLNRLYYSEVIELAKHLEIRDIFLSREPSFYLYRGQIDKEILKFTYDELEDFIRQGKIRNATDQLIQSKIQIDDTAKYMCPNIQRPSNLLE